MTREELIAELDAQKPGSVAIIRPGTRLFRRVGDWVCPSTAEEEGVRATMGFNMTSAAVARYVTHIIPADALKQYEVQHGA